MICRADRLTQVRGVGVETSYTLDAVGNRTRELERDGANAVRRDVSYAYDARQRLMGEIDAVAGRGVSSDTQFRALRRHPDSRTLRCGLRVSDVVFRGWCRGL
jgi:hypothetical protein